MTSNETRIHRIDPLTLIGRLPDYHEVRYAGIILHTVIASVDSPQWAINHHSYERLLPFYGDLPVKKNKHIYESLVWQSTGWHPLNQTVCCGPKQASLMSFTNVLYSVGTGNSYTDFVNALNERMAHLTAKMNFSIAQFLNLEEWKDYCKGGGTTMVEFDEGNGCVMEYDQLHIDPRNVRSLWQTFANY